MREIPGNSPFTGGRKQPSIWPGRLPGRTNDPRSDTNHREDFGTPIFSNPHYFIPFPCLPYFSPPQYAHAIFLLSPTPSSPRPPLTAHYPLPTAHPFRVFRGLPPAHRPPRFSYFQRAKGRSRACKPTRLLVQRFAERSRENRLGRMHRRKQNAPVPREHRDRSEAASFRVRFVSPHARRCSSCRHPDIVVRGYRQAILRSTCN